MQEVKRISNEKLAEVTENLLDERRRAGGDAACIKGVASITDIFVELREARSRLAEVTTLVEQALTSEGTHHSFFYKWHLWKIAHVLGLSHLLEVITPPVEPGH